MDVVINACAHKGGGGRTYLENMLSRLVREEDKYTYLVIVGPELADLKVPGDSKIHLKVLGDWSKSLLLRYLFEQFFLPVLLLFWEARVLFCTADLVPLLSPCSTILMIRNLNPYMVEDVDRNWMESSKFYLQRLLSGLSAAKADTVIFVSDFIRCRAEQYFRLPSNKTRVVHHGIDCEEFNRLKQRSEPSVRSRLENLSPYFLTVSTVHTHKNYEVLLEGYKRYRQRTEKDERLVIVGRTPNKDYFDRLKNLVEQLGLSRYVQFEGGVPYQHVPIYYHNASFLIFPSRLESFGHPLLEAMVTETPIIASTSTALPEVGGEVPFYFNAEDPRSLAGAMMSAQRDDKMIEARVKAGKKRVRSFTWDEAARKTRNVIGHLLKTDHSPG